MPQRIRRAVATRPDTMVPQSRLHFLAAVTLLAVLFALVDHETLQRPEFVTGLAIAAAGLLIGVPIWWGKLPPRAFAPLGGVDIAAAAFINVAIYEGTGTSIGLIIALLPILWLSFWFGYPGAAAASIGAFVVTYAPGWLHGDWPQDGVGWATLSAFPVALSVVSVGMAFATLRYREAQRSRAAAEREAGRIDSIFRTVIEQIDAWLVVFDLDGEVIVDNKALSHLGRLADFDRESMTAGHVFEQDRVTPIPPERQALARLRAGEEVSNEIVWAGPRGRQRAVLINGRTVRAANGGTLGLVLVLQDITEVQTEVIEREESLASLSHELRSPLTSIVGYSDLMEESLEGAPQARTAAIIRRSAEHMLALTESLLSAFRDGEAPQRSSVAVREAVDRAVDMQRSAQSWGSRTLRLEIPQQLHADADPRQLLQILNNLISNAVKYSPNGALITVQADRDEAETSIRVHNTGDPIPTEQLERIFDRFYRRPGAETGTSRGLGIGLALSRRMALAHGGALTASATADGTEFVLQLPNGA